MSFGSDSAGRASRRLAALFALIAVLLPATSTALLYVLFTRETHDVIDRTVLDESAERELVAQAIARLRLRVILVDAAVFAVVGIAGFWYARRTLRPINDALASQRRFIANASHELRTPLAIMKADFEVAQRGPPDVAELRRALDSGLKEVERMGGVVADLLTLSRIDAHEEPLERLQRALFNLVKNAVEHSPQGSRVAVRLACDGERARVQVADRGAGLTGERFERVFERFRWRDHGDDPAAGPAAAILTSSIGLHRSFMFEEYSHCDAWKARWPGAGFHRDADNGDRRPSLRRSSAAQHAVVAPRVAQKAGRAAQPAPPFHASGGMTALSRPSSPAAGGGSGEGD